MICGIYKTNTFNTINIKLFYSYQTGGNVRRKCQIKQKIFVVKKSVKDYKY